MGGYASQVLMGGGVPMAKSQQRVPQPGPDGVPQRGPDDGGGGSLARSIQG